MSIRTCYFQNFRGGGVPVALSFKRAPSNKTHPCGKSKLEDFGGPAHRRVVEFVQSAVWMLLPMQF